MHTYYMTFTFTVVRILTSMTNMHKPTLFWFSNCNLVPLSNLAIFLQRNSFRLISTNLDVAVSSYHFSIIIQQTID